MSEDFKHQRDRYIAFSLAAADLLIEIDFDLKIKQTLGATHALLGTSDSELKNKNISTLFDASHCALLRRLIERAKTSGRVPLTRMSIQSGARKLCFNLGATMIPSFKDRVFITLAIINEALLKMDAPRDETSGLLSLEGFQKITEQALASDDGQAPKEMKLVRLDGLSEVIDTLSEDQNKLLMAEIGAVLRANALGGSAAGQLDEESFSYIPDIFGAPISEAGLSEELKTAAQMAGVGREKLAPKINSIHLSTQKLEQGDVTRALAFVLNDFCRGDTKVPASLAEGFKSAVATTVQSLDGLRTLIETQQFMLFYQPVVSFKDRKIHHHEALMRFADGRNPFETIRMTEQLGLARELDLSVLKMAIDTVQKRPDLNIAVNMSGLSAQSDSFREGVRLLVAPYKDLSSRLMFELTESSAIDDMEAAANFIKWLRRSGFEVALDDFGAGASAYSYLRKFDVDYVKIDGEFLKEARENRRQRALIHSICVLCKELDTAVIAEMVEDEATAVMCMSMGIDYGQGYLFGRPEPEKNSRPPEKGPEPVAARRRGIVEGWG